MSQLGLWSRSPLTLGEGGSTLDRFKRQQQQHPSSGASGLCKYNIRDEAVSRQDLYMSCLETCSEAAEHIAMLTRQKRQGDQRNRFLQSEVVIKK
ncbi:hypothetical protein EYF80_025355 [Liparis tanakae]|uniref:Uncharacterized protein n=1 Tax=Liparis tanakae TaxID=230148 RepID=A0A4Z2HGN0_9TELE|nr:hypothetical protein EYF80_025355 [Liparis tanakae]